MQFTRWYDKDNRLKFIINILEKFDDETRNSLASDLIQILINTKYPETDELIEHISSDNNLGSDRWYDNNETVHSAVEMLKFTDTEDKQELINEFLYSIVDMNNIVLDTLPNAESSINHLKLTNFASDSSYTLNVLHTQKQNLKKIRE